MAESRNTGRLLRKLRGSCFHQRIESITGSGIPDLVILKDGITYWIEMKSLAPTKDEMVLIRPLQYLWHCKAEAEGVPTFIANLYENTLDLYLFKKKNCKTLKSGIKVGGKTLHEENFDSIDSAYFLRYIKQVYDANATFYPPDIGVGVIEDASEDIRKTLCLRRRDL